MTRERAIEIATAAHSGQKRKRGANGVSLDYITHPLAVAEIAEKMFMAHAANCSDVQAVTRLAEKIYIVGVCHDVIEDTAVTPRELASHFPDIHIMHALHMLTRSAEQTYYDFIQAIAQSKDIVATVVKLADLEHNMSDLAEGSLKDKYRFAHKVLSDAMQHHDDDVAAAKSISIYAGGDADSSVK